MALCREAAGIFEHSIRHAKLRRPLVHPLHKGLLTAGDAWSKGYDFGAGVENKIGGMFNMGDGGGFDMSSMMGDVGSIAGDTGSIADSLSVTDEELEYLRDIAERDAINRFTTAEVKIDMTGMTNKIDGSADIDGIITELTDGFTEALVTAAEGVHE